MFILKKGHQPGVNVPLRALFLVFILEFITNLSVFSSPVQSTGRAIVVTLASAFALALVLPFPSRHF